MIKTALASINHLGHVIYELMADLWLDAFKSKHRGTSNETKWMARYTLFMMLLGVASIIMLAM